MSYEENCIKKLDNPKVDGRVLRISQEFKASEMEAACKAYNCSVEEGMRAICGLALKEYAMNKKDITLDKISVLQTNSLGRAPTDVKDLEFGSTQMPQHIELPVHHDLNKLVEMNKEIS